MFISWFVTLEFMEIMGLMSSWIVYECSAILYNSLLLGLYGLYVIVRAVGRGLCDGYRIFTGWAQ